MPRSFQRKTPFVSFLADIFAFSVTQKHDLLAHSSVSVLVALDSSRFCLRARRRQRSSSWSTSMTASSSRRAPTPSTCPPSPWLPPRVSSRGDAAAAAAEGRHRVAAKTRPLTVSVRTQGGVSPAALRLGAVPPGSRHGRQRPASATQGLADAAQHADPEHLPGARGQHLQVVLQ